MMRTVNLEPTLLLLSHLSCRRSFAAQDMISKALLKQNRGNDDDAVQCFKSE